MERKSLSAQGSILLKTGPTFLGTGVHGFVDKSSIIIKRGKFEQIHSGQIPRGTNSDIREEIDLENYYVMPSLIDLHVHLCMSGEADFTRKILESPPESRSKLSEMDNVIFTPLGWYSKESMIDLRTKVAETAVSFIEKKLPRNVINMEAVTRSKWFQKTA